MSLVVAAALAWASSANAAPKIEDPNGTPVTITATKPDTVIFLAHGDVGEGAPTREFERLGLTPITIRLAPGVYTVEADEPSSTLGHARFSVDQGRPLQVDVRNGNATVRGLGSAIVGLGTIAVLLGVVAAVTIGPNDKDYNRWGIAIPLLAGGVAGIGVGVGFLALGATNVNLPPGAGQARGVGFSFTF